MRKLLVFVVGVGVCFPSGHGVASPDEIHVLSAVGMRQVLVELLAVPGVVVIGPLPGELDGQFVFSAALVSGSRHADAG